MFVSISKEAREAFILGQLEQAHQCKRRWTLRELEAQAHILDAEATIDRLNQQLETIDGEAE